MSKPIKAKVQSTAEDEALTSFYASDAKIYARDIKGRLQTLRKIAVWVLLGMFYVFPWLTWGGRQAVLFDLPARKFYVFGLNFWPQDFIYLAMLLMIAGFALFFFTALAGRLWCGYACPQTVWTEVFMWFEHHIEGDRAKRMKLDDMPWNAEKIRKKGLKHLVWLIFALWTGFTFVGFFTPIQELAARTPFIGGDGWSWGAWETFWIFFYALATWGNAGFLREQVCKYMCPYARFQSAMFDRNTLLIAYDPMRGEPRGPRKRGTESVLSRARGLLDKITAYRAVYDASGHEVARDNVANIQGLNAVQIEAMTQKEQGKLPPDQLGDCINCTICVQVCPTGIDIRDGLQYECIACGACIDACDSIMDKMGYPRGLIRYSTQNAIDGQPSKIFRPRIFLYGVLLLGLFIAWAWGITHRSPLIVEVLRDRNALYRVTEQGSENIYTFKLVNKRPVAHTFNISMDVDDPNIQIQGAWPSIDVAPEAVKSFTVTLQAPKETKGGQHTLSFHIQAQDDESVQEKVESTYFAPSKK